MTLGETAQRLIRRGIIPQEDRWNGWVGPYQKVLNAAIALDREHPVKETRRDRNKLSSVGAFVAMPQMFLQRIVNAQERRFG